MIKTDHNSVIDKLYRGYRKEASERPEPDKVRKAGDECEKIFGSYVSNGADRDKIWDSVCEYGDCREKEGYFAGFKTACQLFNEIADM